MLVLPSAFIEYVYCTKQIEMKYKSTSTQISEWNCISLIDWLKVAKSNWTGIRFLPFATGKIN